MGLAFHTYLKDLRLRYTTDTRKLSALLNFPHSSWNKVERGINPPPKPSILKKFALITMAKKYEETQLFVLAKHWKPSSKTNHPHALLIPPKKSMNVIGEIDYKRRVDAAFEANRPDYIHKFYGN